MEVIIAHMASFNKVKQLLNIKIRVLVFNSLHQCTLYHSKVMSYCTKLLSKYRKFNYRPNLESIVLFITEQGVAFKQTQLP